MIAWAAIDMRGGRVVQLVGGRPEDERVSLPDPGAIAEMWLDHGFAGLHVVDLDAALGQGDNTAGIEAVLGARRGGVRVQVGGGIRDTRRARDLVDLGADRVVVGTRAVQDPGWLAELAAELPDRVVVAADMRDGEVVVSGWTAGTGLDAVRFVRDLAGLPLAAVLVTDVTREGQMTGADVARFGALAEAAAVPLIASGGIRDEQDLEQLEQAGAAGVVLGMSLYTGALDGRTVARKWNA